METPSPIGAPPRRRNVAAILAWFVLVLSFLLMSLGHIFRTAEFAWQDVTAVVQQGHELAFTSEEGEQHVLLHLSPPAGAPAWQEGDKVKLSYYRGKPQFAVLREQCPEPWSDRVEVWGLLLLILGAPLAFFVSHCQSRKRRKAVFAPVVRPRRSVVDWLAYAAVGLTLGFALVGALMVLTCLTMLITALHYDPDPNAAVAEVLFMLPASLLGSGVLALISCALYRRDQRRYGLNRE